MKKYILWFKEITRKRISSVGGKAANLGELYSKFPIPNGFCITVNSFEYFLQTAKIKEKILRLLKIDVNKPEKVNEVSKKIKNIIVKSEIPFDLKTSILENYKRLGGFVAVRSSALAEDLKEASFAGQQSSFLNVNKKDLIRRIKECWASFYTTRAIIYREKDRKSVV